MRTCELCNVCYIPRIGDDPICDDCIRKAYEEANVTQFYDDDDMLGEFEEEGDDGDYADWILDPYNPFFGKLRARGPSWPVAYDMDDALPRPNYNDDVWNTPRLVFGREMKADLANYSDRLWNWDRKAAERAGEATSDDPWTPRTMQKWLSVYHGKPVKLIYVKAGINPATQYEYFLYGYNFVKTKEASDGGL